VVGFAVVGSYPEILDNSKEENLPLEGVKQRHKVKLRKEKKPEKGRFPGFHFFQRKTWKEWQFFPRKMERDWGTSGEANRPRSCMGVGLALATPSC
jgi:hypothetical protein